MNHFTFRILTQALNRSALNEECVAVTMTVTRPMGEMCAKGIWWKSILHVSIVDGQCERSTVCVGSWVRARLYRVSLDSVLGLGLPALLQQPFEGHLREESS